MTSASYYWEQHKYGKQRRRIHQRQACMIGARFLGIDLSDTTVWSVNRTLVVRPKRMCVVCGERIRPEGA